MSDPQVVDYIKKARAAGMKDENIRFALFQNGWSEQEINENLLVVGLEGRPVNGAVSLKKENFSKPEIVQPAQDKPVSDFKKPKKRWLLIFLTTVAVIIIAGMAVFAFGKPLLNWLDSLKSNNTETPVVSQENAGFTPKLPDYTISLSELANLTNFEQNQKFSFSEAQKQALEDKNFFITANYDKFYGTATANAGRNDDWTGLYKTIGGPVFITTDFLTHVYYKLASSDKAYSETDDPNAFIFSTLTQGDEAPDEKTGQKLPSTPTALMVSTLMGSKSSADLLNVWIQNNAKDSDKVLADKMATLQDYFNKTTLQQWTQNIYWSRLYTIKSLFDITDTKGYPMFVKSEDWNKKTLQAYLGSWTELKHDALLGAKQGDGTVFVVTQGQQQDEDQPKPLPKGYVEPNIEFFDRMIMIVENNTFKEALQFYKKIAVAELQNEKISDDDFEKLRLSAGKLDQILQSPDSQVQLESNARSALIADVYTDAKKQQILYEANGVPNYIFVAVKDANGTRLTKGLVYSYYEFTDSLSKRLTDHDWQRFNYSDLIKKLKMQDWNKALIK